MSHIRLQRVIEFSVALSHEPYMSTKYVAVYIIHILIIKDQVGGKVA